MPIPDDKDAIPKELSGEAEVQTKGSEVRESAPVSEQTADEPDVPLKARAAGKNAPESRRTKRKVKASIHAQESGNLPSPPVNLASSASTDKPIAQPQTTQTAETVTIKDKSASTPTPSSAATLPSQKPQKPPHRVRSQPSSSSAAPVDSGPSQQTPKTEALPAEPKMTQGAVQTSKRAALHEDPGQKAAHQGQKRHVQYPIGVAPPTLGAVREPVSNSVRLWPPPASSTLASAASKPAAVTISSPSSSDTTPKTAAAVSTSTSSEATTIVAGATITASALQPAPVSAPASVKTVSPAATPSTEHMEQPTVAKSGVSKTLPSLRSCIESQLASLRSHYTIEKGDSSKPGSFKLCDSNTEPPKEMIAVKEKGDQTVCTFAASAEKIAEAAKILLKGFVDSGQTYLTIGGSDPKMVATLTALAVDNPNLKIQFTDTAKETLAKDDAGQKLLKKLGVEVPEQEEVEPPAKRSLR